MPWLVAEGMGLHAEEGVLGLFPGRVWPGTPHTPVGQKQGQLIKHEAHPTLRVAHFLSKAPLPDGSRAPHHSTSSWGPSVQRRVCGAFTSTVTHPRAKGVGSSVSLLSTSCVFLLLHFLSFLSAS